MNKKKITGPRRGPAAELRFMAVHPAADRIGFDGHSGDGKLHRFTISAQALQTIAGGDFAQDIEPIRLFERCKPTIFGVASRAFDAGVRGDPIELSAELFRRGPAVR